MNEDSHTGHIKQWQSEISSLLVATPEGHDQKIEFCMEGGVDSVTKQCQLLSNESTNVRVLDTPGLADSKQTTKSTGVIEANRALFRSILRVQDEFKMKFDRVVYFLPIRGSLDRADRNLQEELQVMHYFYGSAIFDSMVVIATYHKRKQENEFNDVDMTDTKKVLKHSLKSTISSQDDSASSKSATAIDDSPPIVYISMDCDGEDILHKLQEARVKNTSGLIGKFQQNICSRCPVKILYLRGTLESEGGGTRKAVDVMDSKGEIVDYQVSTCHPIIIPKYSTLHKYAGGIAHITSVGALKVILYEMLHKFPGFFNSDEICPVCKKPPGAPGCKQIGELCTVELKESRGKVTIQVDHDSQLDNLKSTDAYENIKG